MRHLAPLFTGNKEAAQDQLCIGDVLTGCLLAANRGSLRYGANAGGNSLEAMTVFRILLGVGVFLLGYYVGREVGRSEPIREELRRKRERNVEVDEEFGREANGS